MCDETLERQQELGREPAAPQWYLQTPFLRGLRVAPAGQGAGAPLTSGEQPWRYCQLLESALNPSRWGAGLCF